MKKLISVISVICLLFGMLVLASCGTKQSGAESGKLKIVTTVFPEYDWVREILSDKSDGAELTMLLDTGVDLHSYQPTVDDILKITNCDVFIYVGGESDKWVDDALKQADGKDLTAVCLLDILGDRLKEEEIKEGMEAEAGEEEESEEEEGPEYDEHVWLSLKNAKLLVNEIAKAIAEKDSENSEAYLANAETYTAKLDALDKQYQAAVDGAKVKTLVFCDRFPFRYLTDDYGIDYYAAFVGCSAETEASFKTVSFLAQKVDELSLDSVIVIEGSDGRIANTVIENTKAKSAAVLTFDSMQATTSLDVKNGVSYLATMEKNLETLKAALGTK